MKSKLASSPKIGVKVIAGADRNQSNLDSLAAEIGGTVYFDPNSSFFAQAGGNAVPHWWVTDREGKILEAFSGSPSGSSEKTVSWFLDEKLGITKYLSPS